MKTISEVEEIVKTLYEDIYKDGELCISCEYNQVIRERRPWGNTYIMEVLKCCLVPDIKDCPGVCSGEGEWE